MIQTIKMERKMERWFRSEIVNEYDQEYHNHKPQTDPWHREEEPHKHDETPGRQTKQSNQLSLPHQDDFKNKMDIS